MKNDRIGNPRVPSRRFPAGRAQTCAGAHPLLRVTSSKLVWLSDACLTALGPRRTAAWPHIQLYFFGMIKPARAPLQSLYAPVPTEEWRRVQASAPGHQGCCCGSQSLSFLQGLRVCRPCVSSLHTAERGGTHARLETERQWIRRMPLIDLGVQSDAAPLHRHAAACIYLEWLSMEITCSLNSQQDFVQIIIIPLDVELLF